MATEIERKFLVTGDGWRDVAQSSHAISQAYLAIDGPVTCRIRLVDDGQGVVTIKADGKGISRGEYEYGIPRDDALELLDIGSARSIQKTRHHIPAGGEREWEVDVFEGALSGLVLAEIELGSDDERFERPHWLGKEVTGDRRYYNSVLASEGLPR